MITEYIDGYTITLSANTIFQITNEQLSDIYANDISVKAFLKYEMVKLSVTDYEKIQL